MDDRDFMRQALDLAQKGEGYTSPNPMVGAVIVKDGKVVGKGYHQRVGGAHAEVNAIDDAGDFANDATLYVTLEPCNHHGRTPPCTENIVAAGIKKVVVAMQDPNPDVKGGGSGYLRQQGIEVRTNVCEQAAQKLNETFIKYTRTKRPFVIVKCAATLDGQIATKTGDSKWITGPKARKYVHRIRHAVDAIMVGVETVKKDDPRLTTRLDDRKGADPVRIVLDTHLSIPEEAMLLRLDSESDTILITGKSVSRDRKDRFEKNGVRVVETAPKNGRIDLDLLMDRLGDEGITSLLVEGGSRVIASAFRSGIVDKILFFYAPKILGGNDGFPICSGPGPERMKESLLVKNMSLLRFDEDVMIEGYIAN